MRKGSLWPKAGERLSSRAAAPSTALLPTPALAKPGSDTPAGPAFGGLPFGRSASPSRFKERVLQTPNDLLAAGFEEHKFQNFFNAFYSVVELVEKDSSVSSLLKVFNDQSSSDRIVQFLRLLTSAFIRNRGDFFRHFIDEEMDIKDFCTHEVEPMAMECDHIQITALSQALNIALQVEYVDEMDTALNHHVFPEAAIPSVYLLYKTSHYNILYTADKR
uniref:ubiquitinyl hydrolase 1 n=1 Tax=Monodon monoceros TaxID=40151 RepID=A0A8C6C5I2_MONMO